MLLNLTTNQAYSTTLDLKSLSILQICDVVNVVKRVSLDTQATVSYIQASDIPSDIFISLWDNFNLFHSITTTLWRKTKTALFRIMPNEQYECPAAVFQLALAELLFEMGLSIFSDDYILTGSARYISTDSDSTKEADAAFSPGPRLASGRLQPPSLVIEVGLSETLSKL
ncbi:unnamed protein product [Penicillium salamii]|nr:unnamed protein product [Penicillium salamii]